MNKNNVWSETLRNKTYTEIADMFTCEIGGNLYWLIGASELREARFKHSNGNTGFMTVENAVAARKTPPAERRYIIERDDGGIEEFRTVDMLIDDGWVLD
jgi:hypothetical protein